MTVKATSTRRELLIGFTAIYKKGMSPHLRRNLLQPFGGGIGLTSLLPAEHRSAIGPNTNAGGSQTQLVASSAQRHESGAVLITMHVGDLAGANFEEEAHALKLTHLCEPRGHDNWFLHQRYVSQAL